MNIIVGLTRGDRRYLAGFLGGTRASASSATSCLGSSAQLVDDSSHPASLTPTRHGAFDIYSIVTATIGAFSSSSSSR